ncbi:hypothetical protein KOR42_01530 [Thalassoglobus neptunius]|uniref:Zinc-finger domain-containing protein n=1 Tax=Thalassoglobus neptunius TaxID=1938619 RepID=A0A5C5X1U0_9PLAN|nr:DUF3379 domain-containing protein [Thalassoglobus neptunius]TWT56798.1 hypothetical protein KOR42_01530 [Thalassoglobus neptunius]
MNNQECDEIRQRIDCLPARERETDDVLSSHLMDCPECHKYAEFQNSFDRQLRPQLLEVAIPEGLKEQILQSTSALDDCDLSESEDSVQNAEVEAELVRPATVRQHQRGSSLLKWVIAGTAVASVIVVMMFQWTPADPQQRLTYDAAKDLLLAQFQEMSPEEWDRLSPFDQSFETLGIVDPQLSEWTRSETVGMSLDDDPQHEVAICEFRFRQWSGVLITFSADEFDGVPEQSYSASGQSVLQWRSPGGDLAYVCIVEQGSAEELLTEILGNFA